MAAMFFCRIKCPEPVQLQSRKVVFISKLIAKIISRQVLIVKHCIMESSRAKGDSKVGEGVKSDQAEGQN